VFQHAHLRIGSDAADFHRIQSPLLEDAEDFFFTALLRNQQHALLRLAEHDLVGRHPGFALRDVVEFDFDSGAATSAHLAGRTGQPGRAHVLYSNDRASLHRFQARFQQQFLEERISDLNVWPLRFRAFTELLARHRGAVDAVASGLGAYINYRIALTRRASIKDLVAADQTERKCVNQRIAGVARLKLHLAAKIGDAETIAVRSHAGNHALHDRVILMNLRLRSAGALARVLGSLNRSKAQRVHYRDRPRSHGENIAQNSADASGRSLKRFYKRRVIVRLDLESARPTIADINDASIFPWPLHNQLAACGQTFQVNARRLIGAVLAPHHAENSEFGPRGLASAEKLLDFFEFFRSEAVLPDHLRRNGSNRRGGHRGIFIVASPPTFRIGICVERTLLSAALGLGVDFDGIAILHDSRDQWRTKVSAPYIRLYCRR